MLSFLLTDESILEDPEPITVLDRNINDHQV